MKSFLKFILSHSVFVAFCAAGLTYQSFVLSGKVVNTGVCGLVYFSTIGAYNFYWILSKWSHNKSAPISFSQYRGNFMFLLIAFVAVIDYLWQMTELVPLVMYSILFTILYALIALPIFTHSLYRLNVLVKTFLLAFTWTYVTVVIPLHDFYSDHCLSILFLNRFLFLLMLCIIFDAKDSKLDSMIKMSTLNVRHSQKQLSILMFTIFILNSVVLFKWDNCFQNDVQVFILMASGVLAFLLYLLSLKKRGYLFYYLLVDGLMLLSSFASYLATI